MGLNSNMEPRLQTGCAQPYVAVRAEMRLVHIGKTKTLVNELVEWINSHKLKIAGPLFYRYYMISDTQKSFYTEIGFPVSAFVEGDGRVITGHIPDGTFATLMHCDNPDNLEQSFEKLEGWAIRQGIQFKKHTESGQEVWGGRFEFFMNADEPDMNRWRMAIAILIEQ